MKRWPTPGRIILGVLLLSAAVAALTLWPHSCLFQIPSENMVGFDEVQGLFYTTHPGKDGQVVSSYDLMTGVKRSSHLLNLSPGYEDLSQLWPCRLSGDKRFLIAARRWLDQVHVLKLPSLIPVPLEVPLKDQSKLLSLGVSQDGGALLLRNYANQSDFIHVLDLDKVGIQTVQIGLPLPISYGGFLGNSIPPEEMHMTKDRRYLATSLNGGINNINVLYDMTEKKELLRTKESKGVARFTTDGQTLVFLPKNYPGAQLGIPRNPQDLPEALEANWYRLDDGQWSLTGKRKIELVENEYILQACDNYFVTARIESTSRSWLKQLPKWLRDKLAMSLPAERVHLRFWDLATGRIMPELGVAIPLLGCAGEFYGYHFNLSEELMASADGRYVAANTYKNITVWETSPRRSLACWLTALCLAFLAGWLVWPRRVKQPQHS